MSKLVDSDQPDAIGLSLDSPNADRPDLGFEFKLGRVNETVGYQSAYSEAYSVYNVRLDIRPIVVQRPLYQYR
jgi:cyanophycinase